MNPCLLDTDILSEVLRGRNQEVTDAADAYLKAHGRFSISAFTKHEIERGLRWRNATTQLTDFERLCRSMAVCSVTDAVLDRAADLWADAATHGKPKNDADLLIAATALVHGLELATGNTDHFDWISGLTVSSWRN